MTTDTKDEFAGQGGSYRIGADGKRVRVEAPTQDHPQGNRARDAQGRPLDVPSEPAPADAAGTMEPAPETVFARLVRRSPASDKE